MLVSNYSDSVKARQLAIQHLEELKELEKKRKMYTWKKGSEIISHTNLERLKEIIKELGYEWSDGTTSGEVE